MKPSWKTLLITVAGISTAHAQLLNQAGSSAGSNSESIVALVESDIILRSELEAATTRIRAQYADKADQLPPANVLEKQVLERLIVNKLQVIRAEETGVQATDTEVDAAMSRVAQSNQMTPQQLQAALAQDGVRLSDFRTSLREELLVQKLRGRVASSRADVSESEIDIALASSSLKKGEVQLAHILIALPDNATNEQVEMATKKIEGVRKLIDEKKMEFSAAAIRYSDAKDALEGGTVGWRRFDQVPPVFADALQGLKKGDVTRPMRSSAGFHLMKVMDVRENAQVVVTEYNARHIIINVDELTSDAEAERSIRGIAEQVKQKSDFAEQAKKFSDDAQTAALGGDMGWFEIETYGTTYAEMIGKMSDGETSAPFRTELGWHLLKREGKREQDRSQEYERNQVRESIRTRKADEAFEQFLRQLRNESYVENRLEQPVDAGSEPELKPAADADTADKG